MNVKIPIELCRDNAIMPTYAHETDGAMDIYAPESWVIYGNTTQMIPTGIKVAIPEGYALLIQPRSGLSAKTTLRIANTPGLIDSGYRDEICVLMDNISNDSFGYISIKQGERIAQMRLVEIPKIEWEVVDNINTIAGDRGGGFGSTGK